MCRLFVLRARQAMRAEEDLAGPGHSLRTQSCRDRRGECHENGWGVGWYQAGRPQVIRSTNHSFVDPQFVEAARGAESDIILGHVRQASVGSTRPENCHPFVSGRWMFAHNGTLVDFAPARSRLLEMLPAPQRAGIQGETDSEHVFALILSQLQRQGVTNEQSAEPALLRAVLIEAVQRSFELCPGTPEEPTRLNFLLTDGVSLAVTRHGHTLYWRRQADSVAIASEATRGEGWQEMPDRSVMVLTSDLTMKLDPLPA